MEYTIRPRRSYRQMFTKFLYNREERSVMGRDAKAWRRVTIFYFFFYLGLFALCTSCHSILLKYFIDPRIPKYQLQHSLIGTSPGLGYRPMPSNQKISLIQYSPDDYSYWKSQLVDFLSAYKDGKNIVTCNFDSPAPAGKVCGMNLQHLDPCTEEKHFSFDQSKPCIFIKLNRIFNWVPQFYDVEKLPDSMPQTLKDEIQKLTATDKKKSSMVWLSCYGVTSKDATSLGTVEYFPYPGFPGYFFPYTNTEGYLSPLVAVHLKNPKRSTMIQVECRAWARNINYMRRDRIGLVRFELMIE